MNINVVHKIVSKARERYDKTLSALSFLILRSYSVCIRGSRSLQKSKLVDDFIIACDCSKSYCRQKLPFEAKRSSIVCYSERNVFLISLCFSHGTISLSGSNNISLFEAMLKLVYDANCAIYCVH